MSVQIVKTAVMPTTLTYRDTSSNSDEKDFDTKNTRITPEAAQALKAQVLAKRNSDIDSQLEARLKQEAIHVRYRAKDKILKNAKIMLNQAQKDYDEAMEYGRMGQKNNFSDIYDGDKLKASFDFDYDSKTGKLKDGYMQIKEYDENGNIIKRSITHDSTKTWIVYKPIPDLGKEDIYKISSDFKVSEIYCGAERNPDGTFNSDLCSFTNKGNTVVCNNIKGMSALSKDCYFDNAGLFSVFDSSDNIVDCASNLHINTDLTITADGWFHFDDGVCNEAILDFGREDEKTYHYNKQERRFYQAG